MSACASPSTPWVNGRSYVCTISFGKYLAPKVIPDNRRFIAPLLVAVVGAVLVCARAVNAQDSIDSITITAPVGTQDAETGEVVEFESSVARSDITSERLVEGSGSVARALARNVGVQTRGTGGFGTSEFLSIRAGSRQQTGVFLDGIRLNGATNPAFDFAAIDAIGLQAVELYRGGTPLALGSGDIGGAVNLRTSTRIDDDRLARIGLQVGSFGSAAASVGSQGRYGAWHVLGSLSARSADNDFDILNNNGTSFNTLDDRIEARQNADASRLALLARLRYDHSTDRSSSLLIQGSQRDTGIPTINNSAGNNARLGDDAVALQATHILNRLGAWNTRQTLFLNTRNTLFDDRDSTVGLGAQLTGSGSQATGLRLFAERPGVQGTASLALDFRSESLTHRDDIRGGRDLEARRQEWNIRSHYALWLPGDTVVVTPQLSWSGFQDRVQVSEEAEALRGAPASSDETVFTQGLGFRAELGSVLTLRGNAARVHRRPSFGELFGDSGLFLASPDLVSETGVNADLSVSLADDPETPTRYASLTVFHSRRDDLIANVFDARGVGRAENIASARVDGVELELGYTVSPRLRIDANLTWQDTRQISSINAFDGRQLPGQAVWAGGTRVEWRNAAWRIWYSVDHERGRFFDTGNVLPASDSTLQRAGLAWARGPWALSLSMDNLGDVVTEDFRGFPHPGRAVFFDLNLTL